MSPLSGSEVQTWAVEVLGGLVQPQDRIGGLVENWHIVFDVTNV